MRECNIEVGWDVGMLMSSRRGKKRRRMAEERDSRNLFNYRTWAYVNNIRKQLQTQSFLIPAELHKSKRDTIHWNSFKRENESSIKKEKKKFLKQI